MNDSNQETTTEGGEAPPADATIELRHTGAGIDISVMAENNPMNPAIHFATWLGRNLQPLLLLAREDYNAKVAERKTAQRLLTPTPRIVSANGGTLQ